jgi:hypothetical protein
MAEGQVCTGCRLEELIVVGERSSPASVTRCRWMPTMEAADQPGSRAKRRAQGSRARPP